MIKWGIYKNIPPNACDFQYFIFNFKLTPL